MGYPSLFRPYHILGKHSLLGCSPLHNRDKELIQIIKEEKELNLCSGGDIPLNFIHPDDISEAIIKTIGNEKTYRQTYNLVNPKVILAKDYYQEIGRQMGKEVRIKGTYSPPPTPISSHFDKLSV